MQRRRILAAGGVLALAPLAFAQGGRTPTIGALIPFAEAEAETKRGLAAFVGGLDALGWRPGHNVRLDIRHGIGDAELRRHAADLATLQPGVVLVQSNQALAIARQEKLAVPIVFLAVSDPVGSGFVANLARPGGNATGFTNYEPDMGAKWVQVLKELAPAVQHVALLLDPGIAANRELAGSAERGAAALGIGVTPFAGADRSQVDDAIARLRADRRSGLIVLPNPANRNSQKQIIDAAARLGVPAIYPFAYFARNGGLAAYGVEITEMFRLAAGYVDRVLRGAKPGELPVQQPTKYQLTINLRTANAMGLAVPAALLARADEVVQ